MDFQVDRTNLGRCRFVDAASPTPGAGQALLAVDAFALSANNITYALLGDELGYWKFFPAPAGWGRIPVWGFATVVATRHPALREGTRVFGLLPPTTSVLTAPDRVGASGFVDASPHRVGLPPAYNAYGVADHDPAYTRVSEAAYMLLRPLFFLSFMVNDFLRDQQFFGARQVLVASASSKAALGLAFLLARHAGVEVVGLTSPQRVRALAALGAYSRVVAYDRIDALGDGPSEPSVYVDLSGNGALRAAVHARLGDALRLSLVAGATHWQAAAGAASGDGPEPTFFFTPDRIVKRTHDWGRAGLAARFAEAWHPFLAWTDRWLRIEHSSGAQAVERVYREILDGRAALDVAQVLTLRDTEGLP